MSLLSLVYVALLTSTDCEIVSLEIKKVASGIDDAVP
jgi:hypothetical protein